MSRAARDVLPRDAAPLFAALGDPTRLALLSRLNDGLPRSVVQLTEGSGVTRQAISKHLRVLEAARMVRSERVGRETLFAFRRQGIDEARSCLARASAQWDDAANRLKDFLATR